MTVARIRTISGAVEYIRKLDPESCISAWWLRSMCKTGAIKCHRAGVKYLIDIEVLENFLANPPEEEKVQVVEVGKLRKAY